MLPARINKLKMNATTSKTLFPASQLFTPGIRYKPFDFFIRIKTGKKNRQVP